MKVAAAAVDFRAYKPSAQDRFLVDTNVWLDLAYPALANTTDARLLTRIDAHSSFVKSCRECGAQLLWCGVAFAEIAHVVEKTEREIYQELSGEECSLKRFRHQQGNRLKTIGAVNDVWDMVCNLGSGIPSAALEVEQVPDMRADFANYQIDGYDLLLVRSMTAQKLTSIITDDADYLSVPGIVVFTANEFALREANKAGKSKS